MQTTPERSRLALGEDSMQDFWGSKPGKSQDALHKVSNANGESRRRFVRHYRNSEVIKIKPNTGSGSNGRSVLGHGKVRWMDYFAITST